MSMVTAALLAVLVGVTPSRTVEVRILSKQRPASLRLSGPREVEVAASGERLLVGGRVGEEPLRLASGNWRVLGAGVDRRYEGTLSVEARGGEVVVVVGMPLEAYVAGVTAGETPAETPFEALRAQAIVARSYVLASGRRHAEAEACDLAHCQVLRGAGAARHLRRARDAALSTEGVVLRLADGAVAAAPFHASCGGHTASPVEVFGGTDGSGAEAVPDVCPASPWHAELSRAVVAEAAGEVLGGAVDVADLVLLRGEGGVVARIVDRASGRSGSGDAFTRALGARAGWGRVRSARFQWTLGGERVLLDGVGHGHGVGLCQAGAAELARRGLNAEGILRRYFPRAALSTLGE